MAPRDPASFVDIHSHLVPGVDDGARDVAAVLDSVERFTRLTIRRILTTPHIEASLTLDPERLESRLEDVSRAFEVAAQAVGEHFPEVELFRGHEVAIDVPNGVFADPRLRMAGTSFILMEWPRLQVPPGSVRVLQALRDQGLRPIVAHPERYANMAQMLELAGQWRDAGAFLQVNFGSFVGRYGSDAQATAHRLIRRGWADYLASDFHGHPRMKIYMAEAWDALEEVGGDEVLTYLCRTNPGRVLSDEEPLPVPILAPERGFWARLKGMLSGAHA